MVHTICCASSGLPLAFTVEPCNANEKRFIRQLLEKLKSLKLKETALKTDKQRRKRTEESKQSYNK